MFFHRTAGLATRRGSARRSSPATGSRPGSDITQVGERWSIVTWAAVPARAGTRVTAVAPLPMTTTCLPAQSSSAGHACGWTTVPVNAPTPGQVRGVAGVVAVVARADVEERAGELDDAAGAARPAPSTARRRPTSPRSPPGARSGRAGPRRTRARSRRRTPGSTRRPPAPGRRATAGTRSRACACPSPSGRRGSGTGPRCRRSRRGPRGPRANDPGAPSSAGRRRRPRRGRPRRRRRRRARILVRGRASRHCTSRPGDPASPPPASTRGADGRSPSGRYPSSPSTSGARVSVPYRRAAAPIAASESRSRPTGQSGRLTATATSRGIFVYVVTISRTCTWWSRA